MTTFPDYICHSCQETFMHEQIVGDGFCPDCNGDLADYSMYLKRQQQREEARMAAEDLYWDAVAMERDMARERANREREMSLPVPNLRRRQAG